MKHSTFQLFNLSTALAVVVAFVATTANAATVLYEAPTGLETSVATQMEAVVTNQLPQWPNTANRLYLELWGADTGEAFAKVNVSGCKDGKTANWGFKTGRFVLLDLPQNGLRTVTIGLGDIAGKIDLSAVSNITVRVTGRDPRPFTISRALLLDKGEAKPEIAEAPRVYPIDAAEHHADYLKFREECRQGAVVAGYASSMVAIRPRAGFKWKPIDDIRVRLARGEHESFQILVAPADGDLKDVQVAVDGDLVPMQNAECRMQNDDGAAEVGMSPELMGGAASGRAARRDAAPPGGPAAVPVATDSAGEPPAPPGSDGLNRLTAQPLNQTPVQPSNCQTVKLSNRFAATNVAACVVGYVESRQVVNYEVRKGWLNTPRLGWWPDPILDFQKTTDIKGEDVQSFWVRVTCPTNQPAGDYVGRIKVTVGGKEAATGTLRIHVNDFTVGRVAPLPMIVGFEPVSPVRGRLDKGKKIPDDDYHFAWKTRKEAYCDWLADYYITWCDYYLHAMHWDMLVRLKEQGRLNRFNLAFWWRIDSVFTEERYRTKEIPKYRAAYDKAKELGLLDHAVFGGCSEQRPEFHEGIAKAVKIMKEEFPDVPIISSAKDRLFGTGDSPLKNLDVFIPLVRDYNQGLADKARAEGHKVWWYICNWPPYPCINALLEQPPSNLRVLMGALTQKCKPDGFLYWAIAWWVSEKPITNGPWTDWSPRTFGGWHGDGQWTACGGPDLMPLATLRLENFRDGLEDLWYVKLLEEKLREVASDQGSAASGGEGRADWARRAQSALAVPDEVAKDGKTFSVDPEVIYRWRNEVADLIEEAGGTPK